MLAKIGYIIALFAGSLVCFSLEVITPSFGILALMGVGAMAGAIWFGFTAGPAVGFIVIAAALIIVPAYLVFLVKHISKLPFGRRVILKEPEHGEPGAGTPRGEQYRKLVGKTGTAATDLRPSGAVKIDGARYDASAESGMIEEGSEIKVIRATGMNVVVREMKE